MRLRESELVSALAPVLESEGGGSEDGDAPAAQLEPVAEADVEAGELDGELTDESADDAAEE